MLYVITDPELDVVLFKTDIFSDAIDWLKEQVEENNLNGIFKCYLFKTFELPDD